MTQEGVELMEKLRVESAAPGDIPGMAELEALCFSEPRSSQALLEELESPERHLLLSARIGEELVGYAGLEYVLDEGYITDVAVFPEFRRRGVARALLEELARRGRTMGLSFLTLEVRAANAPAIALYRGTGYREVGRRRDFYRAPREDAVLMTLWLKETGPEEWSKQTSEI